MCLNVVLTISTVLSTGTGTLSEYFFFFWGGENIVSANFSNGVLALRSHYFRKYIYLVWFVLSSDNVFLE